VRPRQRDAAIKAADNIMTKHAKAQTGPPGNERTLP
jgi:hypothetical protein